MAERDLEFDALVLAWRDGVLTDQQFAELNERLLADPDARAAFTAALHRHRQIARVTSEQSSAPSKPRAAAQRGPGVPPAHSSHIPTSVWAVSGLAAALLLSAAVVAIYVFVINPQSEIRDPKSQPPVATLIETTGGTLTTPHDYPTEGRSYGPGQYTLDSGTAEFMLTNAVNVKLRGDTQLVIRDTMNVALARGSATFVVPENAQGFTVHLPDRSRIIDRGTRFTVEIDSRLGTLVSVLEGQVDAVEAGSGSQTPVTAGQGCLIDPRGIARRVDGAEFIELAQRMSWDRLTDRASLIFGLRFDADHPTQPLEWVSPIEGASARLLGGRVVSGPLAGSAALAIDGNDEGVRVDIPGSHRAITLAAWVRVDPDTTIPEYMPLLTTDGWSNPGFHWQIYQSDRFNVGVHEGVSRAMNSPRFPSLIERDRWVHVAVVVDPDASTVTNYVNGQRVHSATLACGSIKIGRAGIGHFEQAGQTELGDRFFRGAIGEMIGLAETMSDDDVAELYRQRRIQSPAGEPDGARTDDPVSKGAADRIPSRADGRPDLSNTSAEIANR